MMCDYNSSIMGSNNHYFNNPLQTSSPVSNQLDLQNQSIGGLSPANESGYNSHGGLATPPSRTNSQWSASCAVGDFTQSDCLLSSAAHTLNNYGAEAYNNSFDLYDPMSIMPFEPKLEPSLSNSPYGGDAAYESLYLNCTPSGTPLPDSSETSLLPDEPPLQSFQELTLDSSFSSNDLHSHSNSLYPVNFDESLVQSQSSLSRQATHLSVNSFNSQPMWQDNNSYDHSSTVWLSPQHSSSNYSQTHSNIDSSYDQSLLLNDDPLNIPNDQLLPQVNNCNIQQLISNAELSGSNTGPDISTPSPSIVTGELN